MQIKHNATRKKTRPSIANTKGIWVEDGTFYPREKGAPNAIYFDSYLELTVYRHLFAIFGSNGVQRQKEIFIAEDAETGLKLSWRADFYIPSIDRAVEAKGKWINNKGNEAHKTLFVWQYVACREIAETALTVVSDCEFMISQIPVEDYRIAFPALALEF